MATVDETMEAAKGWLYDCFAGDESFEEWLEVATIPQVMRAVDQHYAGGFNQFLRDA